MPNQKTTQRQPLLTNKMARKKYDHIFYQLSWNQRGMPKEYFAKAICRRMAVTLLAAASLLTSLSSVAATQNSPLPASSKQLIKRSITLAELGFTEGAYLGPLGGSQEFFFPVPRMAHAANDTLSLAYEEAAPLEGRRSVMVTVGERTVLTRALAVGHERQVIEIPLLPEDFSGDFVKVAIRYSGILTEDRCIDLRRANDRFTVLPETALVLNLEADKLNQVSATLALMPPRVAVGVPERVLTEREMAAVISTVRLFKAQGRQVEVVPLKQLLDRPVSNNPTWQRGDVLIATPADLGNQLVPGAGSATSGAKASVISLADGPGLFLSGDAPQLAANFLGSDWRAAATGGIIRVNAMRPHDRPLDRLTFDQLGMAMQTTDAPAEAVRTVTFSTRDLPAGRWPTALALNLGIGTDGSDVPAVANVFLNGRFLAGGTVAREGVTRVRAVIPHGLVSLNNQVRVVVQRQPAAGDCRYQPASFPTQLLGSSAIELGDEEQSTRDFFALAPHARSQLTVFVRGLTSSSQHLALQALGTVAAELSPTDTPIVVRHVKNESIPSPDSVFLAWGDFHFKDTDVPVRLDRGNVLVRTRTGTPLFNLNAPGNALIAQVVTQAGGAPSGVWLQKAGTDSAIPAPQAIALDRGNVAFVDATGVTLALSTEREKLVEVSYPDVPAWQALLQQHYVWLVIALWLVLTIAVLLALQRIHRRRQDERKEQ